MRITFHRVVHIVTIFTNNLVEEFSVILFGSDMQMDLILKQRTSLKFYVKLVKVLYFSRYRSSSTLIKILTAPWTIRVVVKVPAAVEVVPQGPRKEEVERDR